MEVNSQHLHVFLQVILSMQFKNWKIAKILQHYV